VGRHRRSPRTRDFDRGLRHLQAASQRLRARDQAPRPGAGENMLRLVQCLGRGGRGAVWIQGGLGQPILRQARAPARLPCRRDPIARRAAGVIGALMPEDKTPAPPGAAEIAEAAARISPYIVTTPLLSSSAVDARLGFNLLIKAE